MDTNPDASTIKSNLTLPESKEKSALRPLDNHDNHDNLDNNNKPIISEERFIEGIKNGFDESEIMYLTDDQQDRLALEVANLARDQWNNDRHAEVQSNKSIQQDDNIQSAMASDIFTAIISYLHSIPEGVRDKVIEKFHQIPSKNRIITL